MFNREGLRVGWRSEHEPKRRSELHSRDGPRPRLSRIVRNAAPMQRPKERSTQGTMHRQEAA
jgi:hypothetical protein